MSIYREKLQAALTELAAKDAERESTVCKSAKAWRSQQHDRTS